MNPFKFLKFGKARKLAKLEKTLANVSKGLDGAGDLSKLGSADELGGGAAEAIKLTTNTY